MNADKINRRKALERTSLLVGGVLTTSIWSGVLNGCSAPREQDWSPKFLTREEAHLTELLVDIIIPRTDTPGASEALVHRFIDEMLDGYFDSKEQTIVRNGLKELQQSGFSEVSVEKRIKKVREISNQEASNEAEEDHSESFFHIIRSMTLLGYFTSEVGATQTLRYDPIPGAYEGCIPVEKYGGKTWAEG